MQLMMSTTSFGQQDPVNIRGVIRFPLEPRADSVITQRQVRSIPDIDRIIDAVEVKRPVSQVKPISGQNGTVDRPVPSWPLPVASIASPLNGKYATRSSSQSGTTLT